MLNTIYRLVSPRTFEVSFNEIETASDAVIVRPTYLSICNADQRYYQGKRDPEILKKKLPMALIHEGIGEVVSDTKGEFKPGELVVMVPNTPTEKDDVIAENYLRSSKFRASGFDGFMQDYVQIGRDRLVRLPQDIDREVAAFTEIVSVSHHAIDRLDSIAHKRRNAVGVWGDGNLAYITALLFKTRFPETKLYVFGINEKKLESFIFADGTFSILDIPADLKLDHAFECVGGEGSPKAINQIIDIIQPEATISILGVSEYPVPINTRMILEKGIRMFGSSRSGTKNFQDVVDLYKAHPEVVGLMHAIVGEVVHVENIDDMNTAFEKDIYKAFGKTIMVWDV